MTVLGAQGTALGQGLALGYGLASGQGLPCLQGGIFPTRGPSPVPPAAVCHDESWHTPTKHTSGLFEVQHCSPPPGRQFGREESKKKKGTKLCKTRLSRPSITPPRGCRTALLSGGAGSLPRGPPCCRAGCRLPTVQTVIRTRGDHSSRAPGAAAGKGLCVYRARRAGLPARALRTALFALGFFIRGV